MPLFLVRVKRWTKVTQRGDFSVEANDPDHASSLAKSAIADGSARIAWDETPKGAKCTTPRVEEIELLADGSEDIRESFG